MRLSEIRDLVHMGLAQEEGGEAIGKRFRGLKPSYPELEQIKDSPSAIASAIDRGEGPTFERVRDTVYRAMVRAGYPEPRKSGGRATVEPHPGRVICRHCGVMHTKGQHRFHGPGSFQKTHLFAFGDSMKNPGKGRGFYFFGSFTSKLAAKKKEAKIPGSFIREIQGKYYVMKPRQVALRRVANPKKLVRIYGRVVRVIAKKTGPHRNCDAECKACNHEYFHDFKPGAIMYGQPDGSILIKKG
jgi:hypothetical protein